MKDDSRIGGHSESLNNNPKVQQFLKLHLSYCGKQVDFSDTPVELYK